MLAAGEAHIPLFTPKSRDSHVGDGPLALTYALAARFAPMAQTRPFYMGCSCSKNTSP